MPSQIERVLAALNDADVRYLVVGGVAVVLHGHLRTTADLDLVLQLDAANVARAAQALRAIGLRPKAPVPLEAFTDSDARRRLIDEKGMTVFSLWNPDQPGLEVDLFAEEPFDFDAVHRRALRVSLDEIETVVPSLDDRDLPRGWDEQRRRQNLVGLSLTPAQRLRWLVETMETMRRWQGRARDGRPTEP